MRCVVMQPTYLPWIGYFDLIDQADVFVFLDDVQLSKQSWQVRNRIKTAQGIYILTAQYSKNASFKNQIIKDTELQNCNEWQQKHLQTIYHSYRKTKFFNEMYPLIELLLCSPIINIAEYNINFIRQIADKIGIESRCKFLRSSALTGIIGNRDEYLVNLCKMLDCSEYLSPSGSSCYIESETIGGAFSTSDVKLLYQHYEHPIYAQLHGNFVSHLSIVDLLFNVGLDSALEIIRSGRKQSYTAKEYHALFIDK